MRLADNHDSVPMVGSSGITLRRVLGTKLKVAEARGGNRLPNRSLIVPNGGRAEGRKIGRVPTSSQCFDEEHTRVQATPQDVNGVSLVGELDGLRGDDLQVGVDPTFVTIGEKLKRFLR